MFELSNPISESPSQVACEAYTFDAANNNIPIFSYRLFDQPDMLQAFQQHNHNFPEFILVKEGHLFVSVDKSEPLEFSAGDVLCISPYEIHSGYVREAEKTEYLCLQFNLSLLVRSLDELKNSVNQLNSCQLRFVTKVSAENAALLAEIITKIRASLPARDLFDSMNTVAEIHRFVAILIGKIGLVKNSVSHDAGFMLKVNTYVSEHLGEELSTDTIANALGIEKKYFCRLFKESFGDTFINHLNMLRINRAVHLIQYDMGSLTEIAEEVGFTDYHYFCRCFTKYMGKSPKNFINK